jgi:bifunctional non-homologous end joining protein LigD
LPSASACWPSCWPTHPNRILYAEHLEGDGAEVYERACAIGLEGIVSKQQDAPYSSGRTESWIKVKCGKRGAFPIVAFVEKLGAKPRRIASFYVGRREGDKRLNASRNARYRLPVPQTEEKRHTRRDHS